MDYHSRYARLRLGLVVALLTGCGDDGAAVTEGPMETSEGSSVSSSGPPTTGETTAGPVQRSLVVPEGFALCSYSLQRALEGKILFRAKARVTVGAGHYTADEPIPTAGSGETRTAPFTLPFTIEHQLDLAPPRPYMIVAEEAAIDRGEHMILGAQWDLYPSPGQQTLRIFQYFSESDEATTSWAPHGRPALALAVSDLASVEPLELGTTTRAAFSLWAGFGGALAPCAGPGEGTVTDTFTLEGGSIAFDVRIEQLHGGTMLAAVGEVEGVAIEESEFWNLEYGATSAHGTFDQLPYYAVRFPETPDGECGLWIGYYDSEQRMAAFFLDCSLTEITREVAILDIEPGELP